MLQYSLYSSAVMHLLWGSPFEKTAALPMSHLDMPGFTVSSILWVCLFAQDPQLPTSPSCCSHIVHAGMPHAFGIFAAFNQKGAMNHKSRAPRRHGVFFKTLKQNLDQHSIEWKRTYVVLPPSHHQKLLWVGSFMGTTHDDQSSSSISQHLFHS